MRISTSYYLVSHHLKLLVATNAKEGSPNTNDGAISDVGKALNNEPGTSHLSQPVIIRSLSPVLGIITVGNGEDTNLMALSVKLLNGGVVGVLVRDIERSLQAAAVGVLSLSIEDGPVQVDVISVHGTVEGDGDHLGDLSGINVARDPGAIRRAEAIRQLALAEITVGRPVGILVDRAGILIRAVTAVRSLIAEELLVNAVSVSALELAVGTHGLVSFQVGEDAAGL